MATPSISSLFIPKNATIQNALKQMDMVRRKLLIVVEDEDTFFSLVSVGDLQRALVRGIKMTETIDGTLREKINYCTPEQSESEIKELILKFRAEYMPVVNADKKVVDIYFWSDFFSDGLQRKFRDPISLAIMAGGKGSRLQPITNIIPKALVPVGKKPMVHEILDRIKAVGCNDFHITVNYKHELIKQYFDTEIPDLNINYVKEDQFLGTAGSLFYLKGKVHNPLIVHNCDVLVEDDFFEIVNYHLNRKHDITIISALKHYSIPYGTIKVSNDGLMEEIEEKPELVFQVNSGVYVLNPSVLELIPEDTFFHITELIEKVKKNGGKVGVFPVSEKSWMDIGVWEEYDKTLKTFNENFRKV